MIMSRKRRLSTLTGIIYMGMYNYDDANSLQFIFEQEPTKKEKNTSQMYNTGTIVHLRN